MDKYVYYVKMTAHPGQREAIVECGLSMAKLAEALPGCELFAINISQNEPDVVWQYTIFDSPESHKAFNEMDGAAELIQRVLPLIASSETADALELIGGKGISPKHR